MYELDLTTIIGVIGATLILITFVLNQLGKMANDDISYDLTNLIGGILLIIYAYLLESVPFMALNLVWSAVSAKDVIGYYLKKR